MFLESKGPILPEENGILPTKKSQKGKPILDGH